MALRATSEPKLRAEMRRETIRTAIRELTGMSQPGRTCKVTRGGVRLSSVLFFPCEERMGWNGMGTKKWAPKKDDLRIRGSSRTGIPCLSQRPRLGG